MTIRAQIPAEGSEQLDFEARARAGRSVKLLAIDPGNEQSAVLLYDTVTRLPVWWSKDRNDAVLDEVAHGHHGAADGLAVEMIASYGMAVGASVFDTCVWVGRFVETWRRRTGALPRLVYRRECKLHLCGSQRAKDPNIRQALIDRYGPGKERAVGLKASPGPLYGIKADCWSALAVAITAAETESLEAAA